jgi:hypothetical protein
MVFVQCTRDNMFVEESKTKIQNEQKKRRPGYRVTVVYQISAHGTRQQVALDFFLIKN